MEKPAYFEDNFAAKFLAGQSVFPDDRRIFHRADCDYDEVVALGEAHCDTRGLNVALLYRSGAPGRLRLQVVAEGVLRLQVGKDGTRFDETSPMLLPATPRTALSEESFPSVACADEPGSLALSFLGYRVELDRAPFCLRVIAPTCGVIFESEWEKIVDMPTAPALGLRRAHSTPMDQAQAFLSWRTRNGEHYYGLGEKFNKFEKTGTRSTIWQADTCGSNTTDMSYKAVPVLFSTAGWGLVLHSSYRSYWEIGSFSYATGGMLVEDDKLDLFLLLAPSLKALVTTYTGLTGRPPVPPRWAFGVWMSRATYQNRDQLQEIAGRLRAEEIPCDVLHLDPAWMERGYYNDIGVEVCNFNWAAEPWGQPEDLFSSFADQGFGLSLWINPYFSEDSPAYAEARERGYLVQSDTGAPSRLEFGLAAGIVDFTNPEAKAWWQAKLTHLLRQGAAVFKVDFGDRVPETARFFNGKDGREMHNLYTHLYVQAVYEAVEAARGAGLVWRRPGYIGSQRYPGSWSGDSQVTWEGMAGALRGGLSAAFTGEAFWSHDIGGFVGPQPDEELYIRWMEWGLLTPFARFHGTTPREPWHYGERALRVARYYAALRYSLVPYLLACAQESADTGIPLLRPLALEFPDEPRVDAIDDQYMLGADLLVAPVMQPGQESRWVYFPAGQWYALEQPEAVVSGPGWRMVEAPLEHLPVYVRGGAAIPRYQQALQHLKGPAPQEWVLDLYPGNSSRRLRIPEPGYTVSIDYTCTPGAAHLEMQPAPLRVSGRLVGGAAFQADAQSGVKLDFEG